MARVLTFALAATLVTVTVLAGCLKSPVATNAVSGSTAIPKDLTALIMKAPVTVDADRVASEPSIKIDAKGGIYVAGPTGTIKYATRPQDLVQNGPRGAFQGAIWKSEDGGKTFKFQDSGNPVPYHSAYPGGGDSDIAIDARGTVYVVDQLGLVTETLTYSDDGGKTWAQGSPLAAGTPDNDRQWIYPTAKAGELYMVVDGPPAEAGYGVIVSHTTDKGATWDTVAMPTGYNQSPGPLIVTSHGVIAFGAYDPNNKGEPMVYFSKDGKAFKSAKPSKGAAGADFFPQTFSDSAGNLYFAWMSKSGDGKDISYAYSADDGATWSEPILLHHQKGDATMLWGVAGSAGRIAFSWYGAEDPAKAWTENVAVALGANSATPSHVAGSMPGAPARMGPPCFNGSTCTEGRELGDFQMCAVGPDGRLYVAYVIVKNAQEGGRVTVGIADDAMPRLFDGAAPSPWIV